MVRPADLSTPIEIWQAVSSQRDGLHRPVVSWTKVCDTRGLVEWNYRPAESRQSSSSQVIYEVGVWVTLRFRSGLKKGMRASFGDLTWEIVSVAPNWPRREVRMFCRSVNP